MDCPDEPGNDISEELKFYSKNYFMDPAIKSQDDLLYPGSANRHTPLHAGYPYKKYWFPDRGSKY
jgi:hypothetical protein